MAAAANLYAARPINPGVGGEPLYSQPLKIKDQ